MSIENEALLMERVRADDAVMLGLDVIAPEVARFAGFATEEALEDKAFVGELCLAVRSHVRRFRHNRTGPEPTKAELQISKFGDVVKMLSSLDRLDFFSSNSVIKEQQVIDITSAVVDANYNPLTVVAAVKNPRRFLGASLVSPSALANLIFTWGEISSHIVSDISWSSSVTAEEHEAAVSRLQPSIREIHTALKSAGADIDCIIDDEDVTLVADRLIWSTRHRLSPSLVSNPLGDQIEDEFFLGLPGVKRSDGTDMALEDTSCSRNFKMFNPCEQFEDDEDTLDVLEHIRDRSSERASI